jgi:hypothetical protein
MRLWLLWVALAFSGAHHVVSPGDTVESIAADLGDPALADGLRSANGLGPGEQPAVGDVLELPPPDGPSDQAAVVDRVRGGGTINLPGGTSVRLESGQLLPPGSQVCTDADGFTTIRLAVGCSGGAHDEVSLVPSTCLTIDATLEQGGARSSLVSVDSGSITVQEQPGDAVVTVRTRSGLTSGRGGGFRVHVEDEQDSMRTEALANPVEVFGAGESLALDAGKGVRVETGQGPGTPVDLLLPGSPVRPSDQDVLRIPEFDWTEVPGAAFYQLELALDPEFRDVVLMQTVPDTEWFPGGLLLPTDQPGVYWRVTPMDRFGFLGNPSGAHYAAFPPGVR